MGTDLSGDFDWRTSSKDKSIAISQARGDDAISLYKEVIKTIPVGVWYQESAFLGAPKNLMIGSNPFIAARVDSLLRHLGIRVFDLVDYHRPEVRELVDSYGQHSQRLTDFPILIATSDRDSYPPYQNLLDKVVELAEEKEGKLRFPFMISGFDVKKNFQDTCFGLTIFPRDDFKVISDERLSNVYRGRYYNKVDDLGLPIFIPKEDEKTYNWNERYGWCGGSEEGISGWAVHSLHSALLTFEDRSNFFYHNFTTFLIKDSHSR